MRRSRGRLNFGIGGMIVLLCCRETIVFSDDTSASNLSPDKIFEKVQERYVSLSSYSDEGKIMTVMDGTAVVVTSFTTRLARPNFYQIEWDQISKSPFSTEDSGLQAVWSSGVGNYVQMGWGVQKESGRDVTLADAAAVSGGASTIARMFFDGQGGCQPRDSIIGITKLADEKVGKTDCYVLAGQSESNLGKTFWIGKQDFLIHQIRTEVSSKAMEAAWADAAKGHTALKGGFRGFSSIETYTNIVLNKSFSRADFVPSIPLYRQPNLEVSCAITHHTQICAIDWERFDRNIY